MTENNLCSLDKIKDVIEKIDNKKVLSYEGSIGTSIQSETCSPYQIVELRIAFLGEQNNEENTGNS